MRLTLVNNWVFVTTLPLMTSTPHIHASSCSTCNLRELCLPVGLTPEELNKVDELLSGRRRIKRGDALFHSGDAFNNLYAIRFGFFKTTTAALDGREQVTGFQMIGEILGLDGIVHNHHTCDAIALEDAEVCVLPFERMGEISREVNSLQTNVHRIMSREIVRTQGVMMMLGNMRAEERLAAFILNLLQRLHDRGFSAREVQLRMTREEIGSYLGIQLETVSRAFSRFVADGLISVKQRHITILDEDRLRALAQATA